MRFLTASVVLLVAIIFANSNPVQAAEHDQTISGRLIFENSDYVCDHCLVTLLANGVRPVGVAYIDLSGHFAFANVPRGNTYTIHVELEGFEDVNQGIDAVDGSDVNVLVNLTRKRKPADGQKAEVVNIAEFKELYPKKAVSHFEKGMDAIDKKKYDDAIKCLKQAIELAPTFYEAHNQLGIAYREMGRTDDAEKEFIQAHDLNSKSAAPLVNLTTLYLDENKPDRAVT